MSASEPTASNTIQTFAQDLPFIKFPPFPEPPPGVIIMPFKHFKPRGIQLFSEPKSDVADEDDVELDALGIPTVELRIKHATDECKSNSRKKRKKKKAPIVEAAPVKKLPWYEEWEEGEDLRVTKVRFDANISPVDRFCQSADDFRTGRPWPPVSSGLNNIWDQFRLFTGLLVNPSVFRKAGGKKFACAESPDFVSDDEEDDPAMNVENSATAGGSRPAKRPRSGETLDFDEEDGDPRKLDEEAREEKISNFLSDPEKAVRIFLSSYMREHGLIWTERNLTHTPYLVWFFLAFVLRNGVLPEPVYQRSLKRALDTIAWAKKELPLTHKVGNAIPDTFNEACRECFGRQGGMNWTSVSVTDIETKKKDATITVTDMSTSVTTDIALPSEAQTQLKDAIEDNIDMEVSIDTATTLASPTNKDVTNINSTGWEAEWGDSWGDDEPLNTWAQGDQGTNGEAGTEVKCANAVSSWQHNFATLVSLLGPSAFPLTHTTGIIECSTRRVSAIYFPPGHPKCVPSPRHGNLGKTKTRGRKGQDWVPSADAVEAELDAHFAKVILEPWGRVEGDIMGPEIGHLSRGPAIDPTKPSRILGDPASTATRKPHDAHKDSITLLVQPSLAELLELVPGLGLGAMWIEVVRQKRGGEEDSTDGPAPVDTSAPGRFWYHEDVTGIFPSFYTPLAKE